MKHAIIGLRAAALAAVLALGVVPANPVHAGPVPVFADGSAIPIGLSQFAKWRNMLARHARQAVAVDNCERGWFTRCARATWQDIIAEALREPTPGARIDTVNSRINAVAYRRDASRGGLSDHWATPLELLDRGGDCEDYAIAKYMALKALGLSVEGMYVVVVRNQRSGLAHAVLVVNGPDGQRVLDNLSRRPLDPADVRHYTPIYAVNERMAYVFRASDAYTRLAAAHGAGRR